MRVRQMLTALGASAVLLTAAALAAEEARVPVREVTLDNGLKLLLVERHDAPAVAAGWAAHVGSANEVPGQTGIAHLFEHMMFKGTTTIGTRDARAEAVIMAKLDGLRSNMETEYSELRDAKRRGEITGSIYDPANQTPKLAALRQQLEELQGEQAKLIIKEEFETVYAREGASSLNAFTDYDMTVFFCNVPANKLELWFWMESERLLHPVFREFYSERDVVREERRMRVESDPTAKFEEQFDAMFWQALPYHHPVVGWPSDVESINRDQANRFFATYYAPNNLTAAIVGDLDADQVIALAKRYFGRIPRGATTPPEITTESTEQLSPRRMTAVAETNPSVSLRWHAVPFVHKDAAALDVMSDLLSGRTGRLYRSLVEGKGIASGEPYASMRPLRLGGYLELGAEIAEGHSHEEVERALLDEVERLKTEPVTAHELQKVKNQSLANSFRRLRSNFGLMLQLLIYDAEGDWHYLNDAYQKVQAVTPEDVQRVATAYFPSDGLDALWYSRKVGTSEDPELAALSPQARDYAKRMLAQITKMTDPVKLRQGLQQIKAQAGQAPEEYRAALLVIASRTEARIAELEAAGKEN